MPRLTPGSRWKSQVDSTEIIVVRAPTDPVALTIGGHPVLDPAAEPQSGLVPAEGDPVLVGKRYVRAEGDLEVLVTKAGSAGLAVDAVPLVVKESKPLPATD